MIFQKLSSQQKVIHLLICEERIMFPFDLKKSSELLPEELNLETINEDKITNNISTCMFNSGKENSSYVPS